MVPDTPAGNAAGVAATTQALRDPSSPSSTTTPERGASPAGAYSEAVMETERPSGPNSTVCAAA